MYTPFSRLLWPIWALLLLAACGKKQENAQGAQGQAMPYPVLKVSPQNATIYHEFAATFQGQQDVQIMPRVTGYLEEVYVQEGAPVRKGQVLFRIDQRQLREQVVAAEAAVKVAEANVQVANLNVTKLSPLVKDGIMSPYELETANSQLLSAQASLASARAQRTNAQVNLGYATISSPTDGVIGAIPYKPGSLVSGTTALTTVSQVSDVFADFSIDQNAFLNMFERLPGKTVTEKLKAMPQPQLRLSNGNLYAQKGKLEPVSGLINAQTGAYQLRARFSNPDFLLRSGGSGAVRLPVTYTGKVLIPQSATYSLQNKIFAMLVGGDGAVKTVPIEVDGSAGDFYIVKAGIKPGDTIVLQGLDRLRDGVKIVPQPANADSIYRTIPQ